MLDRLNFHHLRYFHTVAHEGSIARASRLLHTSPPSISVQLRQLEQQLGEPLFTKQGRTLTLTAVGETVRDYADQIFALGGELVATVRGSSTGRAALLRFGVADSVAKELAARLLGPVFETEQPCRAIVREGPAEGLLAELALHRLDVVLLDEPPSAVARLKLFQHALGDAAIGVFGDEATAARLRRRFPASLGGAAFVLPMVGNLLRSTFDAFCRTEGLAVNVVAEVEDSGLAKTLAREGRGLLLAPSALSSVLKQHYGLHRIADLPDVRLPYVACTARRRIDSPHVLRVLAAGRDLLRQGSGADRAATPGR